MTTTKLSSADSSAPALVWFRNDLRLTDHPALMAAVATGQPLVLVYLLDDETPTLRRIGAASRWWLFHALKALEADIERHGATLHCCSGAASDIIPSIVAESKASAVFWSRRYAAEEVAADASLAKTLTDAGVAVETYNGSLCHEPEEIRPQTGGWYKVYSAFWRASQAAPAPDEPQPATRKLVGADYKPKAVHVARIEDLGLLPHTPDWSGGLADVWEPSEAAALKRLKAFAAEPVGVYETARDIPAEDGSSRLSPYLHFGEISPRQIIAATKHRPKSMKYVMEIGWRDFAYHVLFRVSDLATESFDRKFQDFPWRTLSKEELRAWQQGMTGYPIVDAGMRQLWQTGWMHNRIRMVTASFLVKHLMAHWRVGEEWFWDTLCDADPANNAVNWQWVAGTGLDAAPYFRVFNPVLQGEKFDKNGTYVRRFVPELEKLPSKWIHKPWEAPENEMRQAGIVLGEHYPKPMVDHAQARQRALDAFASLRNRT